MKKYKFIMFLLLPGLLFSCLDEDPQYALNNESTFQDINTATMVLDGCYGVYTSWNGYGQSGQELLTGASGLGWTRTNYGSQDLFASLNATSACVIINQLWNGLYKTISECNFLLTNIESGTLNAADKTYLISQAKFLRGLAYFDLMSLFGGVPIRTTPVSPDGLNMPRASKEEVVAQIEADWTEALDGVGNMKKDGYASRYVVHAYLARLYWLLASQTNDPASPYWEKAEVHCDSVYIKGGYDLEPKFGSLFVNNIANSPESIFQLNFYMAGEDGRGNRGTWLFAPQNSTANGVSWGRVRSTKAFHDWFISRYVGDPRYDETFLTRWVNKEGKEQYAYPYVHYKEGRKEHTEVIDYASLADPSNPKVEELTEKLVANFCEAKGEKQGWPYFRKTLDSEANAQDCHKNLILYRYGDFLLMMADVYNERGKTGEAIELVKKVLRRARTSVSPAAEEPADWPSSLSQDEVRQRIFDERLIELAGEPGMYVEVRRRGTTFMKGVLERQNNHEITKHQATYPEAGVHNFRERLFNGGVITEDFLKKNLLLPIPSDEMTRNALIGQQNYGY